MLKHILYHTFKGTTRYTVSRDFLRVCVSRSSVSFSPPEGVVTEEAPHRETRCTGHTRAGQVCLFV